jgi:D-arabinose 1-dehydrogenase-like Zn-dependent alcohol dehydrogenase
VTPTVGTSGTPAAETRATVLPFDSGVKMKAVVVSAAGAKLAVSEIERPEPGPGQVRLRVHACGICHSDAYTVDAAYPGIVLPRVPGHEMAGVVDAIGPGVTLWKEGDRAGIGWFGGADGTCDRCRRGDFITCRNLQVSGVSFDGGYAEYSVVPMDALARIPDELSFEEAAPLLCAGVTTFNSLRHSGAMAGDVVAVLGIGGLGHLGVQYAAKMGFRTVAIARGVDKEALARKLGATDYIDSTTQKVSAELRKLGGARVVLATATSGSAMAAALGGLAVDGTLLVVGAAADPIAVPASSIIGGRKSVAGWPSGTSIDSEDTMQFSAMTGIRPMIETMPMERVQEAYDKMMSGAARFRMVLTTA